MKLQPSRFATLAAISLSIMATLVLPAPQALAQSKQEVTVSEGLYLGWAPFYVADEQKIWAKYGLDVTAVPFSSGRLALDAIVGGRAAFGTVAETPVVFAALNGLPVRVIGRVNTHEVFDLVAKKSIRTIKDVRGKRIGYLQGSNAQYYLSRMLDRAGLKPSDVTAISMNPPDMVTSLIKGGVDAFIWAEPFISQAVAFGKGDVHVIRTPGLYKSYSSIVALQSTIDKNPEVLIQGLRALIEATEYVKTHKDEAIAIAASKTKMDPEIAKKSWGDIRYGIELDPGIEKDIKEQAQWAVDSGLVRSRGNIPELSKVVVRDLLEKAKRK